MRGARREGAGAKADRDDRVPNPLLVTAGSACLCAPSVNYKILVASNKAVWDLWQPQAFSASNKKHDRYTNYSN